MAKIEIKPGDPHFDLPAWVAQKTDANVMAEEHYRNAILTGHDGFKIAFFDSTHRVREIERAIDEYLAD